MTRTMRPIILGGGSVVLENYLPALRRLGWLDGAIVIEKSAASRDAIARAFPAVDCRDEDYAAALDALPARDPASPEFVLVALPNQFHVEAAHHALARDRDVLCEKPLALKAMPCTTLREAAAARGRMLKIAMSRRYLPTLMLAHAMVTGRELGAVRAITIEDRTPFLWKPRSFAFFAPEAGGVLADMGVHYLDFIDHLVGPLTPVAYADDAKGGIESSLTYTLRAGDVAVSLRLSRIEEAGAWISIVCERGVIRIDKADEAAILVTPAGGRARRVSIAQPFDDPTWPDDFHGGFSQMLADFARATAGETTPIADVAAAERAAGLIEWAYARRPSPRPRRGDTVLVTGATGFIGGHLVERLSAGDCAIRVAARSPGKCANVARFPVTITPTDLLDRDSVARAVKGVRFVHHLAYGNDGADPARITIEGTKNIVEASIAAGVECVVVLSTMYVFGFPEGDKPVDESFPYKPYGGIYGESKMAMERWCLERAKASGKTRIVVLNPTCVFGPGGGAYTTLPPGLAKLGRFCWVDHGAGACNYIYVDNLVDAILAAAKTPAAHGERFILNDGVTTWRTLVEPMLGALGPAVPSYSPEELARLPRHGGPFRLRDLAAAALNAPDVRNVAKRSGLVRRAFALKTKLTADPDAPAFSGRPAAAPAPQYPPDWLGPLYGSARTAFSADKARRVLGWTPAIDLAAAREATVRWLADTGRLP